MDFKIESHNIDEWCFRYLENDLSVEEKKFFEQAIEFDETIKNEYLKWNKTKLSSINEVFVSSELGTQIIKSHKSGIFKMWLWGGIGTVTVLSLLLNIYLWKTSDKKETFFTNDKKKETNMSDIEKVKKGIGPVTIKNEIKPETSKNITKPEKLILIDSISSISGVKDSSVLDTANQIQSSISTPVHFEKQVQESLQIVTDTIKSNKKRKKKSKNNKNTIIQIHENL